MNISDSKSLLNPAQISLLQSCAAKPFMLGGFMSLDDIVTKLKVDVLIEPGTPERSGGDYYDKAIEYWKKVLEEHQEKMREDESLREEYSKMEKKLGRLCSERKAHSAMKLLGLYDSEKNIIILYPEAMAAADASRMDEYLTSTLAHEVMHAYFDRPGHESFPYAMFVEEPLAEFGMLLYMHETHSAYYDWAHNNVSGKKCCYGYGAVIMDQYLSGDHSLRKYLEDYKIPIGEYEMLDVSNSRISIPKKIEPVDINGKNIFPQWQDVINNPPRYFIDKQTGTLGLDGKWNNEIFDSIHRHSIDRYTIDIFLRHRDMNLYLGDNFFVEDRYCIPILHSDLEDCNIIISPANKHYKMVNGIVMSTSNGEVAPIYKSCGRDRYRIPQNGKLGVYDCYGNQIVPCMYDHIWSFDDNGLCEVRRGDLHGFVNEQGKEQIPIEYEEITRFENGITTAKKNGHYGLIDEHNNIVHPFDLDYSFVGEFRKGRADIRNRNDKWGAIDSTGKVVVPCIYDSQVVFNEFGRAKVKLNGEEFTIDRYGNKLK